ncbi:S1 family peptidase [Chryseobacterium camelliae]|uniref:S1 family peptidase n=1 Tax=Chryseobacterium camelliae TaxID=1265445 RepID=UPI002865FEF1|nr:S1 family peptidase [Chryseobacterium camelliae]MDR6513746.1 streptogrisin B [Chryseobacterium camelliae]
MRKILVIMLVFMTLLSINACSDTDMHQEQTATEQLKAKSLKSHQKVEGDASHQWEANERLTKLIASFGTINNRFSEKVPKYPDYYGGAYVTDKGALVILIKDDQQNAVNAIQSVIGSGNLEFKVAKYSYSYLTTVMDDLNELALKNDPEIIRSLTSFSLMDAANEIEVEVLGLNDQKREKMQRLLSNKAGINFVPSIGRFTAEITANPGCEVSRNASMAGSGSIGFSAKRNSDGKLGFVTAGHAILVGEKAYYGGTAIGTCVNSQQSGTVDAAFVTLDNTSADNVSNTLCGTSNMLSVSTTLPGAGTTVNKIGQSTGSTSGTIISTNVSVISSTGSTITNMTSANYTSAGGDSGGPVYTYISSSGTRPTAGIHMGASGSTRYFTKASNILSTFGISRN